MAHAWCIGLECQAVVLYSLPMDDNPPSAPAPAGWLDALRRSEAQLAAGQIVPGEEIMRELRESIARLESKHLDRLQRGIVPRR